MVPRLIVAVKSTERYRPRRISAALPPGRHWPVDSDHTRNCLSLWHERPVLPRLAREQTNAFSTRGCAANWPSFLIVSTAKFP